MSPYILLKNGDDVELRILGFNHSHDSMILLRHRSVTVLAILPLEVCQPVFRLVLGWVIHWFPFPCIGHSSRDGVEPKTAFFMLTNNHCSPGVIRYSL